MPKKPLTKREVQTGLDLWAAVYGKPQTVNVGARAKRTTPAEPKVKPGRGSEHAEQCAVISWWYYTGHKRYNARINELYANPNGGYRPGFAGKSFKAEGVRAGVLDLFLMIPSVTAHGLFIEMKYDKNKPTDEQKEFITRAESRGYATAVCWTAEEAIDVIERYLNVYAASSPRATKKGV